jgi:hypothetical protein
MPHRFAGLFLCAALAGCGNGGSPPPAGSINPPAPPPAAGFSIRFFGTGTNDLDRVKIPLADSTGQSLPVNIGSGDFTIEFWIKGRLLDNPTTPCTPGQLPNDEWINGAIVLDRDVFGDGDFGDFGISLFGGRVAFGVSRGAGGATLCGSVNVLDGNWHHVAVTRRRADGELKLFVDGVLDRQIPANTDTSLDVSYRAGRATNFPASDPFLVLGAEKHSLGGYISFEGSLDELRLSTTLRYPGNFGRPTGPFVSDALTAALYHFDEGTGTVVADAAGASPGTLNPSAAGAAAHWSTDTPF